MAIRNRRSLYCLHGKYVTEVCGACQDMGRAFVSQEESSDPKQLLTDVYIFLSVWRHEKRLASIADRDRFRVECEKYLRRIDEAVQGDDI